MIFPDITGFMDGLRPPQRLKPSVWADTYRYLSPKASAEPGRWSTDRTPYLRAIMDDLDPLSPVQEVIFMKGAQIGGTEVGYNVIGYFIDQDPGPILCVMPTEKTTLTNSKMRIGPMIAASPALSKKVAASKSRDSGNTLTQKDFPGGTLILGAANSSASLRSMPIKVLVLDEVDAFPGDLKGEGSPIDLAKARTRTFDRTKKIFILSTPTVEHVSAIEAEYRTTDKRVYKVPCPHCGHKQQLVWKNVIFDSTKEIIEEASYKCESCAELIPERFKPKMLARGEWVPTDPERSSLKRKGYHLSALYSPLGWYSWASAANDFLKASRENDITKLKVFTNTVLAELWKEKSKVPQYKQLYERAGGYNRGDLPEEAALLTAGVDVQHDRFEVEVVGWYTDMRSTSIDYYVINGDTSKQETWDKLDQLLDTAYYRPDGTRLDIRLTAIDSGYNTTEVYKFCRGKGPTIIVPIKGQPNSRQSIPIKAPQQVDVMENGSKIGHCKLWNIGVDIIKQTVYSRLSAGVSDEGIRIAGYCSFPAGYDIDYFKMLTAERLVLAQNKKGYDEYRWEKTRPRNEALDCRVYATAAAMIVGVDRWTPEDWAVTYNNPFVRFVAPVQTKERKRRHSDFW